METMYQLQVVDDDDEILKIHADLFALVTEGKAQLIFSREMLDNPVLTTIITWLGQNGLPLRCFGLREEDRDKVSKLPLQKFEQKADVATWNSPSPPGEFVQVYVALGNHLETLKSTSGSRSVFKIIGSQGFLELSLKQWAQARMTGRIEEIRGEGAAPQEERASVRGRG